MQSRRFIQCDVFTDTPIRGNGLAVVVDGAGIPDEEMQAFAAWTNLAESTFLMPPTDPDVSDYKVRIFSPGREMPFAGHPTLGSCAAWLHAGGVPKKAGVVRQECAVGIVDVDISGDIPAFVAPPTKVARLSDANLQAIAGALSIGRERIVRTALLDNGPVWQVLELESAEDVLALDASKVRWPEFKAIGLIGRHPQGGECDFEVRMLGPSSGMLEDPVTGSLNSAIACWMYGQGHWTAQVTVAQGTAIGRMGRIHIRQRGDDIMIGGRTQILIEGTIAL